MEQERQPLLERSRRDGFEEKTDQKDSATAAVDLRFAARMWRLLRVAQCGDSVWLILLSIVSVAITSQAGLVVGHFYNALISKNLKLFASTIGQSLLWYGGESVLNATQLWAAEYLAIGWRLNLTQTAHSAYCSRSSVSALSQGHSLDNPDERLTNEIRSFCQKLAELTRKTIASPLMILYYTWWVWYHVGWIGPVVIYTFFFFGVTLTRMIISPIAGLVARQERLEANFRISHVRFHASAEEIGMYDSIECERAKLEKDLKAVLANRKKLVSRHFLLKLSNKAYDYLGGILTYCVIAIPVFGGLFDTEDSGELANLISNASFAVLQLIYSFSELMDSANLVSDVAGHCARIGELFEFFDILPHSDEGPPEYALGRVPEKYGRRSIVSRLQSADIPVPWTRVRNQDQGVEGNLICPLMSVELKGGGHLNLSICFAPSVLHEQLGTIFPGTVSSSLLMVSACQCFGPSAQEILFESGQEVAWETDGRLNLAGSLAEECGGQQEVFMKLISRFVQRLMELGHWAGAVNTYTGAVLYPPDLPAIDEENCSRGEENEYFSLIDGTQSEGKGEEGSGDMRTVPRGHEGENLTLSWLRPGQPSTQRTRVISAIASVTEMSLDYCARGEGDIPSAQQSRPGQEDVVSVFSSAPVAVLACVIKACVQEVAASCEEEYLAEEAEPGQNFETQIQSFCSLLPALAVNHVTFFAPGSSKPLVTDLTMELHWGESLLITGPTGSGKTSFLRTLCNLWPLDSGSRRIPPRSNCKTFLTLPQRPLMAKTGLAGQIVYPERCPLVGSLSSNLVSRLQHALECVGMLSLLAKVHNSWELESDWADTLSPGEQQLLSLARVFYHRPQLVILDEATSAVSEQTEDAIYDQLVGLGVTVISVAHRDRLRCYHSKRLEILGDGSGSWSLS